jgi:hypothetical protein
MYTIDLTTTCCSFFALRAKNEQQSEDKVPQANSVNEVFRYRLHNALQRVCAYQTPNSFGGEG